MSTHVGRNDPCPCGSGLKYKQCCAGKLTLMKGRRGWVLGVLGLVLVAAVAWGLTRSQTPPPAPSGMAMPPPSTTAGASTAPSTSSAPSPVPINPAPLGAVAPAPTTIPAPTTMAAPTTMPGPVGAATPAWTYDAATNKHFDPNHGHWHDGPPPAPDARGVTSTLQLSPGPVAVPGAAGTAPSGPTPAPWTYDAKTNQHWDPNHGHWHQGQPPPGKP